MRDKKWIQKSIKHKGSLRNWARKHRLMTKRDTIDLQRAEKYAKRHGETRRLRQINLARTLRKVRKK
ncbi:MAG: hypothetical protein QW578_07380 [Thermoplasmatales archaeon]